MRIRARRIAVGVSEEQYNKINRLTDRSFFTKEQVLRDIILGYPIQEDRSPECIELIDHIDVYETKARVKTRHREL